MSYKMTSKQQFALGLIAEQLDGEHPLQALARLGRQAENNEDYALAQSCYKELAAYTTPKLKAVEVEQERQETQPITIVVQSEEEAQSIETEKIRELAYQEDTPPKVDNIVNLVDRAADKDEVF